MTDPITCPTCGSPDPKMTRVGSFEFEDGSPPQDILVSGFGNPTCIDEWHDGHRPWIDGSEWLMVKRAKRDHARGAR